MADSETIITISDVLEYPLLSPVHLLHALP